MRPERRWAICLQSGRVFAEQTKHTARRHRRRREVIFRCPMGPQNQILSTLALLAALMHWREFTAKLHPNTNKPNTQTHTHTQVTHHYDDKIIIHRSRVRRTTYVCMCVATAAATQSEMCAPAIWRIDSPAANRTKAFRFSDRLPHPNDAALTVLAVQLGRRRNIIHRVPGVSVTTDFCALS